MSQGLSISQSENYQVMVMSKTCSTGRGMGAKNNEDLWAYIQRKEERENDTESTCGN